MINECGAASELWEDIAGLGLLMPESSLLAPTDNSKGAPPAATPEKAEKAKKTEKAKKATPKATSEKTVATRSQAQNKR